MFRLQYTRWARSSPKKITGYPVSRSIEMIGNQHGRIGWRCSIFYHFTRQITLRWIKQSLAYNEFYNCIVSFITHEYYSQCPWKTVLWRTISLERPYPMKDRPDNYPSEWRSLKSGSMKNPQSPVGFFFIILHYRTQPFTGCTSNSGQGYWQHLRSHA